MEQLLVRSDDDVTGPRAPTRSFRPAPRAPDASDRETFTARCLATAGVCGSRPGDIPGRGSDIPGVGHPGTPVGCGARRPRVEGAAGARSPARVKSGRTQVLQQNRYHRKHEHVMQLKNK
ncbi:hypothetical protein EYF80_065531 [Liparis tanakae]|uniref:Uncharacterized protein n=1 Tax=Liparis tanakae TaxID=230148 RepID=A0A4Z2E6E5_9TELE|nr:hypothetical protein EYF80_065531 [Liparis tanakae]